MKTVLITGINGFLGSHLAKKLHDKYNVIGLEYSLDNLWRLEGYSFPVFLSDSNSMQKVFENYKIDIIVHLATFYGKNDEEIQLMLNSNLLMPFSLLDHAIKNKSEVFINTDTALSRYVSAYSLTKKQFHDWLFFRKNEIKTINMQLEHFYGPGASSTNFISLMLDKLMKNEPHIDLTLGEQKRDFVYIDDVIDAYELIVSKNNILQDKFSHFEVGTGTSVSIKDLMIMLKEMTASNTKLNFGAIPYRENELMISVSDNCSITELGWKIKYDIKEGFKKTIEQLREI